MESAYTARRRTLIQCRINVSKYVIVQYSQKLPKTEQNPGLQGADKPICQLSLQGTDHGAYENPAHQQVLEEVVPVEEIEAGHFYLAHRVSQIRGVPPWRKNGFTLKNKHYGEDSRSAAGAVGGLAVDMVVSREFPRTSR